ncbi:hypothetical protein, partial [Acinetobacter sp. AM]|uniref:hypothetical protein n=1 Tax=Acinetobacter sp. AM TaxID=2170730 RepID=UPI001BC8924C
SSVKRVRAIEIYRNIRNLKDYIKSLKSIFQMRTRPNSSRKKLVALVFKNFAILLPSKKL